MFKRRDFSLLLVLGMTAVIGTGCGSTDPEADEALVFSDALTTLKTQMADVGELGYSEAAARFSKSKRSDVSVRADAAFGNYWDSSSHNVAPMPDESNDYLTVKEFMGRQLDPSAVGETGDGRGFAINVFGRFNNAMMIGCALMSLGDVDASTGYPAIGTMTVTLNSESATKLKACGMSDDEAAMFSDNPMEFEAVVTAPEDTTVYDRKVIMLLPEAMGGAIQTIYLRFNAKEINILNVEDGTYDSRTIVAYDQATKVLRVEYWSGKVDSFYFYRLFYDETNDIGRIVAQMGGRTNNFTKYTLVGKPNSAGTFALSFDINGSNLGTSAETFTGDFDRIACIDSGEGTMSTDNSLSCTLTGTSIDAVSTAFLDAASAAYADPDWVTTSDTQTVVFDGDTIFTEAPAY